MSDTLTDIAEAATRAAMLVGSDVEVDLVGGGRRRYTNLDYAASTPPLKAVRDAVDRFLPWYSSVHRGTGLKSQVATAAYEGAREVVRSFFHARPDDAVLFTRNTTDSMNLLASALPDDVRVLQFPVEHHANLLPWRAGRVQLLPFPASPTEALSALKHALRRADGSSVLIAVTGASNVTGELWPIDAIARLAREHGARVVVDAAQLAPHAPIDMDRVGIDYLAASGHKLYAPYGAGVLIGRSDWLAARDPHLRGGGAVRLVTLDDVLWADLPDRQEAGSPNVVGAVALAAALRTLSSIGMSRVAAEEARLYRYAVERLRTIEGLEIYTPWGLEHPHIGLLTFNLAGIEHGRLAAILSAEYGVGIRHGCFCAHPLLSHLLHLDDGAMRRLRDELRSTGAVRLPGAARMSMGIDTAAEDVDRLAAALAAIAADGPSWTYRETTPGEWAPSPDPRTWPDLGIDLAHGGAGESS